MAGMDEFALIRLLNGPRARARASEAMSSAAGVTVGIGDDAAVVQTAAGAELVMTCDTMVETVHFTPATMRYSDIGYKAMASNISDIAAMGAVPRWALAALSVPRTMPVAALQELYDGLYECAEKYGVAVIGGDTTSSPAGLTITVTLAGEVAEGRALLRSAARPGDAVFVTGPLGGSAAGLRYLLERGEADDGIGEIPPEAEAIVRFHRRPEPRVEAGRVLADSGLCGALNDISDGLASEAWEIAEASGVCVVLDRSRIPIAAETAAYAASVGGDPIDWALYGGEDYELVGTVPASQAASLGERFEAAGLKLWIVGEVRSATGEGGAAVKMVLEDGTVEPILKKGFNHFA